MCGLNGGGLMSGMMSKIPGMTQQVNGPPQANSSPGDLDPTGLSTANTGSLDMAPQAPNLQPTAFAKFLKTMMQGAGRGMQS